MKKIIKNKIILIVILCIISCGIGVYAATTYKASDVVYNASDGTSMNVNDALNELYKKKNDVSSISGRLQTGRTRGGAGYATITFNNISAGKKLKLSNYTTNGAYTNKLNIILPDRTISASNGEYSITKTGSVSIYLYLYYADEGNDYSGYVDYMIY